MTFELVNRSTGEVTFSGVSVTRRRPCEICGHPRNKATGWCLRDETRGLILCGHAPSKRRIGEAGYLHGINGSTPLSIGSAAESKPRPRPPFDASIVPLLMNAASGFLIERAALHLGVSIDSLRALDVGWSTVSRALAFPMRDGWRRIVGIRYRRSDGSKFAESNSRNALFFPPMRHDGPVLLPEGPTDTAAMLTLGFDAIGRPFCRGGIEMLQEAFSRMRRHAVIIQDLDSVLEDDGNCRRCGDKRWCQHCRPGQFGAMATASALLGIARSVKIIAPPPGVKDARKWLAVGATRESVEYRIDQESFWSEASVENSDHGVCGLAHQHGEGP